MWRRSGAPDNALDATTLRLLQPQAAPPPRPLALCVAASLPVLERALCSTLCLLGAIGLGCVPHLPLLLVVAITALSCAATAAHLGPSGAVLWLLVASVTPVLRGLTESFATDAVWAWAAAALCTHVATYDYYHASSPVRGDALSQNAATLAAVVLASQLPQMAHVLVLMQLGVALHVLAPHGGLHLRRRSARAYAGAVCAGAACTVALAWHLLGPPAAAAAAAGTVVLGVVVPCLLYCAQPLKAPRWGPWDCADVPHEQRAAD